MIVITEGIEDALSAHEATGLGAWAAGSAPYMPALAEVVPHYIDHVIILAHRDATGINNARQLSSRLAARNINNILAILSALEAHAA
jgi:hypothetical protein